MKQLPNLKQRRAEERREREKKYNRTITRNWIICVGSLAVIIIAYLFFR